MPQAAISVFDPQTANPELWAAYHAYRRATHAELWPGEQQLSDAECEREMMREANPPEDCVRWAAQAGQEVIGFAQACFRKPGVVDADAHAPHLSAGGMVRAEARRQGVGTALLREVLALMHQLGKTILTISARTEAGHAFLSGTGAVPKLTAITSRATLSELDWAALREWEDAPAALGLEWERYAGRVPRERLLALLPEFNARFAEAPVAGLQTVPVRFEIESYGRLNETMERTGSAHHLVMLLEPDGKPAGMTEAVWDARTQNVVYQALTAVAPPWRGRGLAKALKAAMLRQVHASHAQAEFVRTGNAEMNAAMLTVNERCGFKPHSRFIKYLVTRDALDLWSSGHTREELFIM